jgi:predicted nucleic acid-binding Zn ribbon protein
MKDAAFVTCPKEFCRQKKWGKGKVKRQLGTGAGLIFKGSGFYITDYRSDNYKAGAKSESGAGESKVSEAKTSETKKAEAKPAVAEKPKPAAKTKSE